MYTDVVQTSLNVSGQTETVTFFLLFCTQTVTRSTLVSFQEVGTATLCCRASVSASVLPFRQIPRILLIRRQSGPRTKAQHLFVKSLLRQTAVSPLLGGKPVEYLVVCPQNGTAVLKGLTRTCVRVRRRVFSSHVWSSPFSSLSRLLILWSRNSDPG